MKYSTTRINQKNNTWVNIKIRLNDECGNGHQDFAITADIGDIKPNGGYGRSHSGGCCHDEILEVAPEFEIFVKLHLCDYLGRPMHASANMHFHMTDDRNRMEKEKFCKYYMITDKQYDELYKTISDKNYFCFQLEHLGILEQWKVIADEAIETLKALTGQEFVNTSKRSNYTPLTTEVKEDLLLKIQDGYFTDEAIHTRAEQAKLDKKRKKIEALQNDFNKKVEKERIETNLKIYLIEIGFDNESPIYYNHTNQLVFNWTSSPYDHTTQERFDEFLKVVDMEQLPKDIEILLEK